MRLLLRLLLAGVLTLLLLGGVAFVDLMFNQRRLIYAALGRDSLVEACRPVLAARLAAAGFEPADLAVGEEPDITVSTWSGRTLSGPFTFEDGASAIRVDGVMRCTVKGSDVRVEMRTDATPLRAT